MADDSIDLPASEPDETGPYALIATLTVKPDRLAEVERRLLAQIDRCRSEAVNVDYHLHRDRSQPNVLVFYESYVNSDGFKTHIAEDYNTAFVQDIPELLEKMDIQYLRMLSKHPNG